MFLSDNFRSLLLLMYSLLTPIEVWAAGLPIKAVEVRLENEVKVRSERLVLGDVATIYARNFRDFETLSGLVLPQFPSDQKEFRLSAAYIRQRVREALGETTTPVLSGGSVIAGLSKWPELVIIRPWPSTLKEPSRV